MKAPKKMHKNAWHLCALATFLSMSAAGVEAEQPIAETPSIDDLERQLNQERTNQQQSQAAEQKRREAEYQKLKDSLQRHVNELEAENSTLKASLENSQHELNKLQNAQKGIEQKLVDWRHVAESNLACQNARFKENKTTQFKLPISYQLLNSSDVKLTWGVNAASLGAGGHSGTLKVELWVFSTSYAENQNQTGNQIISTKAKFTGGYSDSQIGGGATLDSADADGSIGDLPSGKYCVVAFLREYNNQNSCPDNFCTIDWAEWPKPLVILK